MCGWQMAINLDPTRNAKILLITAQDSLLDKSARKAAFEEKEKWLKVAVVTHDTGQVIMAKIAINNHITSSNTQVFSNKEEALKWLG